LLAITPFRFYGSTFRPIIPLEEEDWSACNEHGHASTSILMMMLMILMMKLNTTQTRSITGNTWQIIELFGKQAQRRKRRTWCNE